MTRFTAPPALLPLYAKAAVTGPLHRGGELPNSSHTLAAQAVDADHLAAYQRVCGFAISDVLPPTYLHVLAFPVTVALMTERDFPFPLVGLVHVANSITVGRAVRSSEQVGFTVRAADLRPHPAGRQLDLLVEASVDDEPVWSGRSTYLRRGGGTGEKSPRTASDVPAGPASVVKVPDDIGRRYAAVSGDRNPIHLHALTAKAFGFRSAIAHGMWLEARTLAALQGRLPEALTVDVAFKTPVFLPSTIAVSARSVGAGWDLDVRNAAQRQAASDRDGPQLAVRPIRHFGRPRQVGLKSTASGRPQAVPMTSTLLRPPAPYRTADTRELREVHRALRRYSRYLAAAAPVIACDEPAAARAIADLAGEVTDLMRRLHAAERDGLWATLLGYLAADGAPTADVARVARRQQDLDDLAARLAAAARRLAESASGADRDEVAALTGRCYLELDTHLAEVERDVLPLVEQLFTFEQGQALLADVCAGAEPQLIPVGTRTRRQRLRSARRFACLQAVLGHR